MRHIFISDVVKELLGPRSGSEESFPQADEPRNEYLAGQLIPPASTLERNPEEEEALATGAVGGEEDSDDSSPSFVNQAFIDAGQNFRRVPSSMGLSFVLSRRPKDDEISVCVTWGRYRMAENVGWIRAPYCWISTFSTTTETHGVVSPDRSLLLNYKISDLKSGQVKVSIYLSSQVSVEGSGRPKTEDIIFQPEIRVKLKESSTLEELGDLGFLSDDEEWRVSTRQYDSLKVYARGHLCGAYWKEIDPQRPFDGKLEPEAELPFIWTDGLYFQQKDPRVSEFFWPDLRTDFIPIYPAPASKSMDLEANLNAELMAECSSFNDLNKILNPLVAAYENWVENLKVSTSFKDVDSKIIARHHEAVRRIKAGIEFLRENDDAFVSFLFMNKVMAKQYAWGRKASDNVMSWHPFQLAFILMAIHSTVERTPERQICDTIWFPTGGGKTEAYLGLAAFSLSYRRRVSKKDSDGSRSGDGTGVVSRYTLRLLTIQQFRRALKMIMACEVLRCSARGTSEQGWLPVGRSTEKGMVWGHSPFSIGLWVGAGVTPNAMTGTASGNFGVDGAITLLKRPAQSDESDPAQILECPCCGAILSFPLDDVPPGKLTLRLHVANRPSIDASALTAASNKKITVLHANYAPHVSGRSGYMKLELELNSTISASDIHRWWNETAEAAFSTSLNSFGAARPGYIPIEGGNRGAITDYEIRCPEPSCELNSLSFRQKLPDKNGQWSPASGHPLFTLPTDQTATAGLKISALTVDKKLYAYPPSMLISTVDKLARMAFINEAASLFGRVRSFDSGKDGGFSQEQPGGRNRFPAAAFEPPSLIIQDELHLLEGPLGSTFGLYETAVERLCAGPKYIASSATIRNSMEQIACLMGRQSAVFPPVSIDVTKGFFLRSKEIHPLSDSGAGRLFLGLAFPGRAPQTPMLRLWGRLFQTAQNQLVAINRMSDPVERAKRLNDLDHFWTLIGYFNAVRELAQGETLVRQDIPQYLDKLHRQNPGTTKRQDLLAGFRNLSSQTGSSELPGILAKMERSLEQGDALNAVASTSMFGTGVDVARLSLMVVHGQPKSASQYIQAVGRIGRRRSGLASIFFRVSKPRDLNHYEYFTGYHRKLPVAVEPITVKPLAPKALDRATGAIIAMLIRNWRDGSPTVPAGMDLEDGGGLIVDLRPEMLSELLKIFEAKWTAQPDKRRTPRKVESFTQYVRSQLERWQEYARKQRDNSQILPYTRGNLVVLGQGDGVPSVFQNVPQSLREVEPTIKLYTPERE